MCKLALVGVFLCSLVGAQDPTGVLEGEVTDASAGRISNAEVTARNSQTGVVTSVRTSPQGEFHFSNLPVGEYSLRVVAQGFTPFSASSIRVDIERVVKFPVQLEVAGRHDEVSVLAPTATVDLGS